MIPEIYLPYFKDKKVTVMGLGLLGRGIGDTQFLAKSGAQLTVTDMKTSEQLSSSLEMLKEYDHIKYVLGEHKEEDFEKRDFILEAAGVPYDSQYILHAKKHTVPVYMSAALLSDIVMKNLPDVVIIGVTGTRGKTTTTEMIAHILRENGSRVHVGGNIRGVANLPILEVIEDGDFLVLELDSWQLQGFAEMKISPHIAVFTSFMDDHMNYYKNNRDMYFNDKANIYRNQHDGDVLIASPQAASEIIMRKEKVAINIPEDLTLTTKLIGDHNQVACRLAYEVGSQCGLDDEMIRGAIASFNPVAGRLEDIGVYKGVRVFNDNNATTPDATFQALESITKTFDKKPILIVGGTDKGLPLDTLEKGIELETKKVIYLSGTGTARFVASKEYQYETLSECVAQAFEVAEEGDIIVFSPGFASFSKYFNNEYERSDEFVRLVNEFK